MYSVPIKQKRKKRYGMKVFARNITFTMALFLAMILVIYIPLIWPTLSLSDISMVMVYIVIFIIFWFIIIKDMLETGTKTFYEKPETQETFKEKKASTTTTKTSFGSGLLGRKG